MCISIHKCIITCRNITVLLNRKVALLKRKVGLRLGALASDPTKICTFTSSFQRLHCWHHVQPVWRFRQNSQLSGWCLDKETGDSGQSPGAVEQDRWVVRRQQRVTVFGESSCIEMPNVFIDGNEINRVHLLQYLVLLFDRTLAFSDIQPNSSPRRGKVY